MVIRYLSEKLIPTTLLSLILLIVIMSGCVSKENIIVPPSQPIPHPKLAEMQSMALEEKDHVTFFGRSKKYYKNGIRVIVLSGAPYEIGYSRGALLRDEINDWAREFIYLVRKKSLGTEYGENILSKRAKELEEFIPSEYRDELQGLSAGSGIDHDLLLVMNILGPVLSDVACASVVVRSPNDSLLRSRNLDLYNQPVSPAGLYFYKTTSGHAFVSISHLPGFIGTMRLKPF